MGIDIYSNSGFTLPYEAFLRLIKPAHVRSIKVHAVQLFLRRFPRECSREALDKKMENTLNQLLAANDPVEMAEALTDSMKEEGKWISSKFEGESQGLCLIQCISRVLLPIEPEEIHIFENERQEDCYGQELNVPILVFSSSQCFKVVMTPIGRTMAKTLGKDEITNSTWTRFSV